MAGVSASGGDDCCVGDGKGVKVVVGVWVGGGVGVFVTVIVGVFVNVRLGFMKAPAGRGADSWFAFAVSLLDNTSQNAAPRQKTTKAIIPDAAIAPQLGCFFVGRFRKY